jgi:hypothetical protein
MHSFSATLISQSCLPSIPLSLLLMEIHSETISLPMELDMLALRHLATTLLRIRKLIDTSELC